MESLTIVWMFVCFVLQIIYSKELYLSASFSKVPIFKGQLGLLISPRVLKSSPRQGLSAQPSINRLSNPKSLVLAMNSVVKEKNSKMDKDYFVASLVALNATARIVDHVGEDQTIFFKFSKHGNGDVKRIRINRRRLLSAKIDQVINSENSSENGSQSESSTQYFSIKSDASYQNTTHFYDSLLNFTESITGSDAIASTTIMTNISNKTVNMTFGNPLNDNTRNGAINNMTDVNSRIVNSKDINMVHTTSNKTDNNTDEEEINSNINATESNNNKTDNSSVSNSMPKFLIEYIAFPVFATACITGNIINIFVMLSSSLKRASSTYILVALAVSDSTFILLWPFNKSFVRQLFATDVRSLSDASCKTFFFIFKTVKMSSAWFVTLISIERFIAIWFPLKAKIINTKKMILIEIISVVLFLSVVNGAWSVSSKIINGSCVPHADVEGYPNMKQNFVVYGIVFVFILPTVIMIILSPLTALKLCRQYKSRVQMTNNVKDPSVNTSASDTIRATVMLLSVTLAFVLLMTPITFSHIYMVLIGQDIFETSESGLMIYRNVSQVLELTNFTINFFLYVLISKSYRHFLFRSCRKKKKNIKTNIKTQSTMIKK